MIRQKEEMQIFLQNLICLRQHYGFSKTKMTKILGISVASWNKIEQGIMPERLSVEVIFRIEKFFTISASNLFRENSI